MDKEKSSKRIFVFGNVKFPRGNAGANYIEYLSLALKTNGWEVIVIGSGKNRSCDNHHGRFIYNDIEYYNNESSPSILKILKGDKMFWNSVTSRYQIYGNDYVIFYSPDYSLFRFFSKIVNPQHVSIIRVEDPQPYQYKLGKWNPKFILYKKALQFARKKFGKVIVISSTIEEQERNNGCKTLLLPIMANPYEFEFVERHKSENVQLLYPGMKATAYEDDVVMMMKAIMKLTEIHNYHIKLHITGIKHDKFRQWADSANLDTAKLMSKVIVHDWLEYTDLIRLYQDSDFLLLPRKINAITKANFPSKVPEAMSFGIIPICTVVGDYTKYYLQDCENSIFISGNSLNDCCNAIVKACELSDAQYSNMRNNARKLVEERFYYNNWAGSIHNFIVK